MPRDYSVIKADPQRHKADLLRIWMTRSTDASLPARMHHWYFSDSNPSGPRQCWLLLDNRQRAIVGTFCLSPRRFKIRDQFIDVYRAADLMIQPEHRSVWPAQQLISSVAREMKGVAPLMVARPTNLALGVILLGGFVKLGEMPRYTKVLKTGPYVSRVIGHHATAAALALPVDGALKWLSTESWKRLPKGLAVRRIDRFDARHDALWERAAGHAPILGERTAAYLNWRYTRTPLQDYSMAELADTADGTVHGYVVYYHVQRHVRISDLFCVDPDTVELLLSEFIKLMRKEGATAISMNYCGNPDLPRVLRRFGFSTRADRQTLTIFPPAHAEPSFIMNDANWQFTDGDEEEEVFMAAAQPAPGALPTGPPPAPAELVRQ